MKKITREELDQILQQHQLWLDTEGGQGQRANLHGAYLRHAILVGTNLQGADLRHANLLGADLRCADLRGAHFLRAELWNIDLRDAKLDVNIRDCYGFAGAKFTPDALPWLILHSRWSELKDSVQISD
jgi:uncharacterized protein YjbI with pentapeptide repeats